MLKRHFTNGYRMNALCERQANLLTSVLSEILSITSLQLQSLTNFGIFSDQSLPFIFDYYFFNSETLKFGSDFHANEIACPLLTSCFSNVPVTQFVKIKFLRSLTSNHYSRRFPIFCAFVKLVILFDVITTVSSAEKIDQNGEFLSFDAKILCRVCCFVLRLEILMSTT